MSQCAPISQDIDKASREPLSSLVDEPGYLPSTLSRSVLRRVRLLRRASSLRVRVSRVVPEFVRCKRGQGSPSVCCYPGRRRRRRPTRVYASFDGQRTVGEEGRERVDAVEYDRPCGVMSSSVIPSRPPIVDSSRLSWIVGFRPMYRVLWRTVKHTGNEERRHGPRYTELALLCPASGWPLTPGAWTYRWARETSCRVETS